MVSYPSNRSDPLDKWNRIVDNVEEGTAIQLMKTEATKYYEAQKAGKHH